MKPEPNVIKRFTSVIYKRSSQARVFVPVRSSLTSLFFKIKPGAYPLAECLKDATLRYALALLTNIRLSWKSLPGTNTLAYYGNP